MAIIAIIGAAHVAVAAASFRTYLKYRHHVLAGAFRRSFHGSFTHFPADCFSKPMAQMKIEIGAQAHVSKSPSFAQS